MSANIDTSTGKPAFAFVGAREAIWHRVGSQMRAGQSMDDWQSATGLMWEAIKAPVHTWIDGTLVEVNNLHTIYRSDTHAFLGHGSDQYTLDGVQPRDSLDFFSSYIGHDDRFRVDTAGALKGGAVIFATAVYDGEVTIGGDAHTSHLLFSTSYDQSLATTVAMTAVRVVCANTLSAAVADSGRGKSLIKVRHSTTFDANRVGKQLAELAQSIERYKAVGDKMAATYLSDNGEMSKLYKTLLDIDPAEKWEDISSRKQNQYDALRRAYSDTVSEGTPRQTVWAALQSVTRYVDHTRTVRVTSSSSSSDGEAPSRSWGSSDSVARMLTADDRESDSRDSVARMLRQDASATDAARMFSTQFGSGAALKAKAYNLLQSYVN
ncbi:MAG TPA: DUF932 domain-containing protein [Candidatus Angelobacter sp.]|nr:DUF932 domain-containing protein [Candidatus Angelobacter sp.]